MIDKTEYARSLGLLLRSVYAYRSLGARVLGVGDWLASVPCRAHRRSLTISLYSSDGALARLSPLPSVRLFLKINISLTIGETYKMVTFLLSLVRSMSSLLMKYLAIISRHPVYFNLSFLHNFLQKISCAYITILCSY